MSLCAIELVSRVQRTPRRGKSTQPRASERSERHPGFRAVSSDTPPKWGKSRDRSAAVAPRRARPAIWNAPAAPRRARPGLQILATLSQKTGRGFKNLKNLFGLSRSLFSLSYLCTMKNKLPLRVFSFFLQMLVVAVGLTACDLIDIHPYDTRISGPHDRNNHHIAQIEERCRGKQEVKFVLISDTQRWYDETHDAVRSINARGVDFVIHCGDLTDFGATKEFELMRDELQGLEAPYVCLIGNHDHLGNGVFVFRSMFGPEDFAFDAGDTHFVALNTNALENDYSVPIPNFAFIGDDRAALAPTVRRTVVAMHAMPFTDQFNDNVADIFQERLRQYPALQFCLCGHNHRTVVMQPFEDGIDYYQCGAAKSRQYLIFTLTSHGDKHCEVVDY